MIPEIFGETDKASRLANTEVSVWLRRVKVGELASQQCELFDVEAFTGEQLAKYEIEGLTEHRSQEKDTARMLKASSSYYATAFPKLPKETVERVAAHEAKWWEIHDKFHEALSEIRDDKVKGLKDELQNCLFVQYSTLFPEGVSVDLIVSAKLSAIISYSAYLLFKQKGANEKALEELGKMKEQLKLFYHLYLRSIAQL